jgi:hypothetical protein
VARLVGEGVMFGFDRGAWIVDAAELLGTLQGLRGEDFCTWDPLPIYAPQEAQLWALLARVGVAITPARWSDWATQSSLPHDAGAFADAALEDVALFFTALRRAERFSDGAISTAFDEGRVVLGLARLIQLADQLPYDGRTSPWAEPGVA